VTRSATRIDIQSDPSTVPRLQDRLMELAADTELDEMTGFQFSVAIVEAVNNCIAHAYRGEAGHPVTLYWIPGEGFVTVEIRDRGIPMPTPLPNPVTTAQVEAESGRGWYIIREWTDEVAYERADGENVLTLTRRL